MLKLSYHIILPQNYPKQKAIKCYSLAPKLVSLPGWCNHTVRKSILSPNNNTYPYSRHFLLRGSLLNIRSIGRVSSAINISYPSRKIQTARLMLSKYPPSRTMCPGRATMTLYCYRMLLCTPRLIYSSSSWGSGMMCSSRWSYLGSWSTRIYSNCCRALSRIYCMCSITRPRMRGPSTWGSSLGGGRRSTYGRSLYGLKRIRKMSGNSWPR